MSLIATYDPKAVICQINGEDVYGFADGDMITVEKNTELFNVQVGSQGEVVRGVIRDSTYRITIRLLHTSPQIRKFENMKAVDSVFQIPPALAFVLRDPSSYEKVFAAQCWLQAEPSRSWGDAPGVREYVFFAAYGATGGGTPSLVGNIAGTLGIGV